MKLGHEQQQEKEERRSKKLGRIKGVPVHLDNLQLSFRNKISDPISGDGYNLLCSSAHPSSPSNGVVDGGRMELSCEFILSAKNVRPCGCIE